MNVPDCSTSLYDLMWVDGPFSTDLSVDQMDAASSYCDFDENATEIDWDNHCLTKGIRWSVAYKLGFAVCLIYCISLIVLILGAWVLPARMIGSVGFCCA